MCNIPKQKFQVGDTVKVTVKTATFTRKICECCGKETITSIPHLEEIVSQVSSVTLVNDAAGPQILYCVRVKDGLLQCNEKQIFPVIDKGSHNE